MSTHHQRLIKPPPPEFYARQAELGVSGEDAKHTWYHVWKKNKRNAFNNKLKARQATMARVKARAAAGATDMKTTSYLTNGGYRRHATREEAKVAHQASQRAKSLQVSRDWLAFKREHAKGCIIEGCPLGPSTDEPPMLRLLEHDHRDPKEKTGKVFDMRNEERIAELAKTDCRCLWHHFVRTAADRNFKPASELEGHTRQLVAAWKEETGCQHPCHASMPYAQLVPRARDDPLMFAFLNVVRETRSRGRRGMGTTVVRLTHEELLAELHDGTAVVYCSFCSNLHTLCESAQMFDTPFTQDQYVELLRRHPAFVQHFHVVTDGYDWQGELRRQRSAMSVGQRKRRQEEATAAMEQQPKKQKTDVVDLTAAQNMATLTAADESTSMVVTIE